MAIRPAPPARDPAFVAYLRVSTQSQGRSGLGLEAQREAVARQLAAGAGGRLVGEFVEIESGRKDDRPELAKALAACRAYGATLIVAKLDRLARNAKFLLSVADGAGDGGVLFCDLPQVPPGATGRFFVTLMAAVAELECGLISERTKAALAAAKARGVKLGAKNPSGRTPGMEKAATAARIAVARRRAVELLPVIEQVRAGGASSLHAIAAELRRTGLPTPSGRGTWYACTVATVIKTAEAARTGA